MNDEQENVSGMTRKATMKTTHHRFIVMICLIVFGVVACSTDEGDGDIFCTQVQMNGLEVSVYDNESQQPLAGAAVSYHESDDVVVELIYDETNQYYYGIYAAGTYNIYVTHEGYITQNFTVELEMDGAACSQLELQEVRIYLEQENSDYSAAVCDELYEDLEDIELEMRTCSSDDDCVQLWIPTIGSCGCTHNLVVNSSADATTYEEIGEQINSQEGCSLYGICDCPVADGVKCQDGLCGWNYI